MTKIKEAEEQELLQMIVCLLRAPPFLSKWSFAKSTVLQMTKIKGTEEQELLQIIIRMVRPSPFLCKWSFSKRTVLQMTQIKGTEEHGVLQMIIGMIWHPPCSSICLQMVVCKEDGFPDDQNQGDRGAGIVANDHPDGPASSVLLRSFTNGHLQRDDPPDDQHFSAQTDQRFRR